MSRTPRPRTARSPLWGVRVDFSGGEAPGGHPKTMSIRGKSRTRKVREPASSKVSKISSTELRQRTRKTYLPVNFSIILKPIVGYRDPPSRASPCCTRTAARFTVYSYVFQGLKCSVFRIAYKIEREKNVVASEVLRG